MKKFLFILLFCICCFSIAACKSEVKDEINQEKIDEVIEAIELLPTKAKLSDEAAINYASDLYNALSEEEKALVTNISTLNEALKRLDYYRNEEEAILKVVKNAKAYLETSIPNYVDYKTTSITLPNYYEGETEYEKYTINFTWISSNNNVINTNGEVKHDSIDTKVTLTAKLNTRKLANIEDFSVEVNVGRISFKDLSKGHIISGYLYSRYPGFNALDVKTLDIVNICFASIIEQDGNFSVSTAGVNFMDKVTELRNHGIRVVLSIGGWKDNSEEWEPYKNAAASEASRKQVANAILKILQEHHLDGVDMDWEYPTSSDKTNFTLFMKEIRDTLKAYNKDYLVTAAIPAGTWINYNYNLKELNNVLDYFNIMSYDLDDGSKTSHMCALNNSTYAATSASASVDYLTKNGVSKSKIIIGAAFYGRIFYDVKSTNNGLGQSYSSKNSISFTDISSNYLNKSNVKRYYDSTAHAYYLYDSANQVFISYDDPDAIKDKCNYVIENDLAGIMYWSYTDDMTNTLMHALYDKLEDMKK